MPKIDTININKDLNEVLIKWYINFKVNNKNKHNTGKNIFKDITEIDLNNFISKTLLIFCEFKFINENVNEISVESQRIYAQNIKRIIKIVNLHLDKIFI